MIRNYRKGQLEGRVHSTKKWERLIEDSMDYLEKYID